MVNWMDHRDLNRRTDTPSTGNTPSPTLIKHFTVMAPSTHSNSITDPFSAIYKARPGELPSSLSIESYHIKRDEHADVLDQSAVPPNLTEKSAHSHPKQVQNVFSPSLAGERDRGVRKRMLSNPESLLPSPPLVTYSTDTSTSKSLVDDVGDVTITDTQEGEENKRRIRTEAAQSNPFASPLQTPPRRCGIFFSPPRSLDVLNAKRTRSENFTSSMRNQTEAETMHSLESHNRFSSAFSRAIIRGNCCVDLDSQDLYTIPDLSKIVEEAKNVVEKNVVANLHDKRRVMASIEKLVNPGWMNGAEGNRQPITRVKSAPLVVFPPRLATALCLSGNQLTSSPFAKLERICYFQGLEHLSLRSNHLTELPTEIGNMRNLKFLNLASNQLEFLPSSILKLTDCKLFLSGNPWLKPPSITIPLDTSSTPKTTSEDRQFRWFSQSHGIFYFAPPARTLVPLDDPLLPSLPSLLETCIRKMCITKDLEGEEETLVALDNGPQHGQCPELSSPTESHASRPQSADLTELLPLQFQKILADPVSYFYRCDLCTTRLALKPDALPQNWPRPQHAFQFRFIDQHAGLLPLNQFKPDPRTPNQTIELDQDNLVPIRWNICSLNCCDEHLINT